MSAAGGRTGGTKTSAPAAVVVLIADLIAVTVYYPGQSSVQVVLVCHGLLFRIDRLCQVSIRVVCKLGYPAQHVGAGNHPIFSVIDPGRGVPLSVDDFYFVPD